MSSLITTLHSNPPLPPTPRLTGADAGNAQRGASRRRQWQRVSGGEGRQHPVGRLVAGKWVAAVLLVVVVVGKWAEHASVSGQPVSLSARTLLELHQQPRKLSEDMDDDYSATTQTQRWGQVSLRSYRAIQRDRRL